jgi:hypothetical protein
MIDASRPFLLAPAAPPPPPASWSLSPLELLLPTGRANHSLQLGSRSLPSLLPAVPPSVTPTDIDLFLLAPTDQECTTPGWLAAAVHQIARSLAPDGLACLLVPPRHRPRLLRLLAQHQLTVAPPLLHYPHPAAADDAFIAPLDSTLLAYAFATLTPGRTRQQSLALALLRRPAGRSLLQATLPAVTLIARHPDTRPLFDWLAADSPPPAIVISLSQDGREHSAVLHAFTGRPVHPTTIYKVALNAPAEAARRREAANFSRLPLPAAVRLPATQPIHLPDGRLLLRQEAVSGRVVARLLAAQPSRLPDLLTQITGWLQQWHQATAVHQPAEPWLERQLLSPARHLAPLLPSGDDYLQWLRQSVAALAGRFLPLVAAHHDLTMWNLLDDDQKGLAVLDWEVAAAPALPLTDFYYALADAAAAADGYRDRLNAFHHCFLPNGRWHHLAAALEANLCQALTIPSDLALLCFHACWLGHAANEQRKQQPNRPFLNMVAWAAQHRPEERS